VTAGLARSGGRGQLGRFALLRGGEGEEGAVRALEGPPKAAAGGAWRVELAGSGQEFRPNPAGSLCTWRSSNGIEVRLASAPEWTPCALQGGLRGAEVGARIGWLRPLNRTVSALIDVVGPPVRNSGFPWVFRWVP